MLAALVITMAGMVQLVVSPNVRPCFAVDDATDLAGHHSMLAGQLCLGNATGCKAIPNFADSRVGKYRSMASLSALSTPSLGRLIGHIVGVRSKEQVRWIDAERIVAVRAVVTEFDSIGDWAVGNFPRHAMSKRYNLATIDKANEELSVAIVVGGGSPEPARICFVNVPPKSDAVIFGVNPTAPSVAASLATAGAWIGGRTEKLCSAFSANLCVSRHAENLSFGIGEGRCAYITSSLHFSKFPVLAQRGNFNFSIGAMLIAVVVIAACIALVYVALRKFGIAIPDWVVQVFWIVVVAVVVIFAIRIVLSLGWIP